MDSIDLIHKLLDRWLNKTLDKLPEIALAIVVFVLFYLLATLFKNTSLRFYRRTFKTHSSLAKVFAGFIYFFLIFSGVFLGLEIIGLDNFLTKILAGAGIISVIAGFALKDIASNAFAGLFLNLQSPFKPDDWVFIDGHFGRIIEIGWITTSVWTIEGQKVYIPNQIVYNSSFTNFSFFGKRRVTFKSGVSYGDDLDLVKKVALDEVRKVAALLQNEPVDFYFTGIGSSAYNFELRFWINFRQERDYLDAMSETVMRIKRRFEEENISLAYSVMTLDFGVKGGVNIFDKPLQVER